MLNSAGQFDTSIQIVTPENIAFQYRVAGPFRRLPAYLIDVLIRGAVFGAGTLVLLAIFGMAGLGFVGIGLGLVLWFLLAWFYGGVFETFWNGQTPGKRLLHIRVISVDGQPIGGLQAVLRNVLRVLDGQPGHNFLMGPLTYLLGLLVAMTNDRFQRLGDLAAGTMVVVEQRQWFAGIVAIKHADVAGMAGVIPPSFQASRSLARALATYAQRRENFSLARRMEIARHLAEPLRERFQLPRDTNLDLLLCGLYHRTFITDRRGQQDDGSPPPNQPAVPEDPISVMARLDRR